MNFSYPWIYSAIAEDLFSDSGIFLSDSWIYSAVAEIHWAIAEISQLPLNAFQKIIISQATSGICRAACFKTFSDSWTFVFSYRWHTFSGSWEISAIAQWISAIAEYIQLSLIHFSYRWQISAIAEHIQIAEHNASDSWNLWAIAE